LLKTGKPTFAESSILLVTTSAPTFPHLPPTEGCFGLKGGNGSTQRNRGTERIKIFQKNLPPLHTHKIRTLGKENHPQNTKEIEKCFSSSRPRFKEVLISFSL
jgi:hypothetical protein